MRNHSKSFRTGFIVSALIGQTLLPIFAQDAPVPAPSTQPQPPTTPPAQTQTQTEGAASSAYSDAQKQGANPTALDYLFNKKPQDGTAGKTASDLSSKLEDKIKALDSLNQPGFEDVVTRQRFEKYLNTPESDLVQIQAYNQTYKSVIEALRQNDPILAWRLLFKLNEYPWDAGVSAELGNRIESIWDASKTQNRINSNSDALRDAIKTANWNADTLSRDDHNGLNAGSKPKTVPKQNPKPDANSTDPASVAINAQFQNIPGKLQVTEYYLKSLESKIKIKQNELKVDKIASQIKADFADTVSTLFASKRYRHVIIAANFYRQLFGDGDYPVTMGNQVNKSVENINAIEEGVNVFNFQVGNKEIVAASKTLQGAFLVGDLDPVMRGVPRDSKREVAKYSFQVQRMQNLIEARDFGALEPLIDDMKKAVVDFEPAKPLSLVNAVKLESKMRMGKAKLAAQRGDQAQALEEFKAAAEAWPGNPDLESAASVFFESQDVKNQGTTEFDRLVAEQNYRAIFEKQLPFLAAVKGDSKRENQLKTALEKVTESETALEKANLLQRNGDVFGAWESLEIAAKSWPEDSKLNRRLADLAMKSSEFVSALNKAQEAEARGQAGFSLNWYVNAQKFYPSSQLANDGIHRVSEIILKKDS